MEKITVHSLSPGIMCSPYVPAGNGLPSTDTSSLIEFAHARSVKVVYWTINEPDEMRRLFALGADGVFTNYPDRAVAVLRERAQKDR